MRRVILYISLSLDGRIADTAGGVDWLGGDPGYSGDYGYQKFVDGVDTVLMGGVTYRQITEELSPGAWPYPGLHTYVLTRSPEPDREGITFTDRPLPELIAELKRQPGRDIWVCGGGETASLCLRHGLLDELHLSIMPILLGEGAPLFREIPRQTLRLLHARELGGVVDCRWQVVRPEG